VHYLKQPAKKNADGVERLEQSISIYETLEKLKHNPIGALLVLYIERKDLQNDFPEIKEGDYSRLIEWALRQLETSSDTKEILIPFKDWYASYLAKSSEFESVLSQNMELDAKIGALQNELIDKIKEASELSNRVSLLQDDLIQNDVRNSENLKMLDSLRSDLTTANKKVSELQQKLNSANEELQRKESQLAEARLAVEKINSSVAFTSVAKTLRWLDRNFPTNTRRGELLRLLRASAGILQKGGVSGLSRAAREKIRAHGLSSVAKLTPLSELQYGDAKAIDRNDKPINLVDAAKIEVESAKSMQTIIFPPSKSPKVSIIVLNYNKGEYTFNCLSSVQRNTKPGSYEIILVDNGSTEEKSKQILKRLKNAKVLTPSENLGFIKGNNYASKFARGEYILFLNNDTIVLQGWLDALLRTFEIHDKVGAVGSKLIYPDGTLQEAGSIIWNDGSGKGYGRNESDPTKPEYNFVREVDYCSGASLMVRRELFAEVGGFNEFYAPAYFEDADLCFSLRKRGYKVLYNPFSIVVHYEGVTSTRDPLNPTGTKRFEIENRPKFASIWKEELERRLPPLQANQLYARDLRKGPSVLIFDGWIPQSDKSSGDFRSYTITEILSQLGCKVTMYISHFQESEYANALRELGVEIIPESYIPVDQFLKDRAGYYTLAVINANRMALANTKHSFYQVRINDQKMKIVLHVDDIYGFCKIIKKAVMEDTSDVSDESEARRLLEKNSLDMLESSEFLWTISEREAPTVKALGAKNVVVIPEMRKPVPLEHISGFDERHSIIYVGGFSHTPNITSARTLINDIFPKVKAKIPDVKLYIIGNAPPPEFLSIEDPSIKVTGLVKDLSPYYNAAKVSAAPMFTRGGVKGKVIEALNFCTPVVTSPIGIEGTELRDGETILVAKDNDEFAEKIVLLFEDQRFWESISQNGRKYFEEHNSTLKVEEILDEFVQELKVAPSYTGAAASYAQRYRVEAPLAILLMVYNERKDLQNAFPEVRSGQYRRLIEWAGKYGVTIDSQKAILSPYKEWFATATNIQ